MLSDRDALLAAIRANPEEDTPRLMFADWLDEHGQPERAEFIRAQCELARLADDGSDSQPVYEFLRDRDYVTRPSADWVRIDDGIHRRITLAARADELIAAHGADWLPRLPKRFRLEWGGFRRGFPHRLTLNDFRTRHLAELAPRLRATVPAVALVAGTFNDRSTRQLADADLLGHISGLELSYDCWAGLREFGRRPEAAGVRTLTVRSSYPAEVAAALVDSPRLTGLRELDLSLTPLSATDAEELFRAPHLRALKRLRVLGHRWTAETVRALAAGGFGQLTSLRLTHAALDDEAAEVLAGCPALAGLRDLDLGHNAITGRGVTALLTSPHLANVAFLGLEANPCGGVDADRLAAAAPGGLRMLHCHDSRFRTSDVRALARCPRLRTLWYLDLDAHNIGTPAVRELVRGFKDFCPPVVWLTYNRIDDRGAELLAKWKAARALRVLHLRYNPDMTDAGARALLDSPHLTNLDDLGVSNVGAETTERMRARFKHFDINY